MSRICLVIIYNHNYEKNIPVIDRIYAKRFSNVYHVMPFYQGNDPHVIGVYESSYQFSGYIAQAATRFVSEDYSHYVFVADDMVINPTLNEENFVTQLGLGMDDAFISNYSIVSDSRFVNWGFATPSVMNLQGQANACEWQRFLPSLEEARMTFASHGLDWRQGVSEKLYRIVRCGCRVLRQTPFRYAYIPPFGLVRKFFRRFESEAKTYPLAFGYSDFCVLPRSAIRRFSLYAGVLAACRVFVEIAIPTAMLLSCKRVMRLSGSKWKSENGVDDYRVRQKIEVDASMDYQKLLAAYPEDYLYIHPIKLSKWRNLP